jgi:hypothetical protein
VALVVGVLDALGLGFVVDATICTTPYVRNPLSEIKCGMTKLVNIQLLPSKFKSAKYSQDRKQHARRTEEESALPASSNQSLGNIIQVDPGAIILRRPDD